MQNIGTTDILIDNFCDEILLENEKKLLKCIFSNDFDQSLLDVLLSNWNVGELSESKLLLFAYLKKYHPNLHLNDKLQKITAPLFQRYRMNNIVIISPFIKAGKVLNENNIYPLILKGLAMKHFRQDLPRIMGDVDFLVKENDFMKSVELIVPLGYYYEKIDVHSVDLHDKKTGRNAIDIHRFISMGTKCEKNFLTDLYKRASLQSVFGVKALVPCLEDMMFITLVNLARNLREATSKAGILYSIFDCKFFIDSKKDFDWSIVQDNAIKTDTITQIDFAVRFINSISENIFSENIKEFYGSNKNIDKYSTMVLFKRFYLKDLRTKCRALKLSDIFKNPSLFISYLILKPRYQFLKSISKHPKLIKFLVRNLKDK